MYTRGSEIQGESCVYKQTAEVRAGQRGREPSAVTIEKPPSGPLGGGDISAGPEVGGAGERVRRRVRAVREGTWRSGVALTGGRRGFDPEKTCGSRPLLRVSSAAGREAALALTGEGRKWQTAAPQRSCAS